MGSDVAGLGDVDGDGWDDLVIGAKYHESHVDMRASGKAYVCSGPFGGLRDLDECSGQLTGMAIGEHMGSAVAGLGDHDGDGVDDLIIGASGMVPEDNWWAGGAYLWLGPATSSLNALEADGAIFGDHCSLVSDTTVMSSIASGCDHTEHVRTQLPYALVAMIVAAVAGYGWVAYSGGSMSWLAYPVGIALLWGWLLMVGKEVGEAEEPTPDAPSTEIEEPAEA